MFKLEARTTWSLDVISLQCRPRSVEVNVMGQLRDILPNDVRIRRSVDGIHIPSSQAHHLLRSPAEFEIRWSASARRFVENRRTAHRLHGITLCALTDLRADGLNLAKCLVADTSGADILDAHQVINVAAMTINDGLGLCLFDEQGAGKTVSLIFAYDLLASRSLADQCLIVAPKSMLPEWEKDFERFRPGLYKVATVTGSLRQKLTALRSQSDVYVANFETVVAMEHYFEALLRTRPARSVLVVDESFFIKSPDARRTQSLRRLREWCGRAFVLCGTPAPNSPHDLIEQFNLVDFGVAFQGVKVPPDRAEALPIVKQTIEQRGLYIRHLKSQVLPNLPSKRFHRLYIPLQPRQEHLYDDLRERLVSDLCSISEREFQRNYTTFLARKAALLQICSNPISVVDDYEETPAKLVLLDSLLDRWIRREGEKVVLWSFFRASIDAIVSRYAKFGALRYDGSISDVEARGEIVWRFQNEDDVRLFVGNPAAAGAGLTLHKARVSVYESFSNQAAHYLQSLDRIHRRGQERDVTYVVLLCQDTIEVAEYQKLVDKQRLAGQLLGDSLSEPVTRESFLSGLISRHQDQGVQS